MPDQARCSAIRPTCSRRPETWSPRGYSVQQSFALLELAGVKASDSLAVMDQKVANLILGYKNVIGTGGQLEGIDQRGSVRRVAAAGEG